MSDLTVTQPDGQENLGDETIHEPALEQTSGSAELPEEGDRIYLKVPMRDHVELTVVKVTEENNPVTSSSDTAFYFHDGSKLYASEFTKDGYSWAPVPVLPFGAEAKDRNDEIEED